MTLEQIFMGVFIAVMYAASVYIKKSLSSIPEEFDKVKFLSTVIVGGFVGFMMSITGIVPTETSVEVQVTAYIGLVVATENGLKILYRFFGKYIPL